MKIGFVLDDTLDSSDGVQQYVLTLGKQFTKLGHDVHYLVGQTKRDDLENIHSMSRNIKVNFNKNRMSIPLPASRAQIKELFFTHQFDVLHIQMPYSPQLAAKVIKMCPKKTAIVGTFHILPFSATEKFATKLLGTLLKNSLKRFSAFIAVSKPAAEFASQSFGIDCQVIPNPVDVARFKTKKHDNNDNPRIVFLGRLVKRKGAIYLLKAYELLLSKNAHTDTKLEIYGKGEDEAEIRDYIRKHNLESNVSLMGYIDESDKASSLSKAQIAVFPSLGGESFGIVLVEAMAAGAEVVIGGDNPGYRSVLDDDQVLFNPTQTAKLADLLHKLLSDHGLRRSINIKQHDQVLSFDIKVVAEAILRIYKTAIANKRTTDNNNSYESI